MRINLCAVLALVAGLSLSAPRSMAAEPPKEPQAREFVYLLKYYDGTAQRDKAELLARTIEVVRQRLGNQGTAEPQGEGRFVVKFSQGVTEDEAQRLDQLIIRNGQFFICLVDETPEDLQAARRGERVVNTTPFLPARDPVTHQIVRDAQGRIKRWHKATFRDAKDLPPEVTDREWYLVENKAYVTGFYLSEVKSVTDPQTGEPQIGFSFRGKGAKDFEALTEQYQRTEQHPGRSLAIILDNVLYSAPQIRSRIAGSGVIAGSFTSQEVDDLVATLRPGQLPVEIERVPDKEPAK